MVKAELRKDELLVEKREMLRTPVEHTNDSRYFRQKQQSHSSAEYPF